MYKTKSLPTTAVKSLTVILLLTMQSCTLIGKVMEKPFQESCHSHAFAQAILEDYISSRFVPNSPVRLAVVPASAPANMSYFTNEQPGAGNHLAWKIQQEILNWATVPIVEVLNRQDWPGKKEEFYTGNFGAIRFARDAGYDLVLVSIIEAQKSLDEVSVLTKLIETSSGVTVYYGKTSVTTNRKAYEDQAAPLGFATREPAQIYQNQIFDKAAKCIVEDIMADKTTPK